MRIKISTALIVAVPIFLGGCAACDSNNDNHCVPYYEVGRTYNSMWRDGDQFCTYVSNNEGTFDNQFETCINTHIQRLENRIDELQRECEEIFVDPEDLLWCDEDRGVPELKTKLYYLSAMREVVNGTDDCELLGAHIQSLEDLWNSDPPFGQSWDEFFDEQSEGHMNEFSCCFGGGGDEDDCFGCFISVISVN